MPAYNAIPRFIRRGIGAAHQSCLQKRCKLSCKKRQGPEERFIGNAYMFTEKERKALLKIKTDAPMQRNYKAFYDKVKDKDAVTKCST